MTEEQKLQMLSAFMDGQEVEQSFVDELLSDEKLLAKWEEYHKIGAAIRGELPNEELIVGFAHRVEQALEKEPVYINVALNANESATNNKPSTPKEENNIVIMSAFEFLRSKSKSIYHVTTQLALAASVAAICVFGAQMYSSYKFEQDFTDKTAMNSTGISIAPVANHTNNDVVKSINLNGNEQIATDKVLLNEHTLDAAQLKKLEKQRTIEMQTIDALLRDHEQVKQTVFYR